VSYFGFVLEREVEPLASPFPEDLAASARAALSAALAAGQTSHPDQGRLRRALERAGVLWRRSGGVLAEVATERLLARIDGQLGSIRSWQGFLDTRLALDVDALIPAEERARLDALPASIHLLGDRVPVEYDVEGGVGVVRLRLKEGQARRLTPQALPDIGRPLRFTVVRGKRDAIRASDLDDLRRQLGSAPRTERARRERRGRRPRRR
jgi:hypothetical protein